MMSATIISLPHSHPPRTEAETDGSLMIELRRARIRIAQLEASLTEALRDSLANHNRAREAERKLDCQNERP